MPNKIIVIGLTGSIGMGKSTVANMLEELGCAIWNADKAVHKLYNPGGAGVRAVGQQFDGCTDGGFVDRKKLFAILKAEPEKIKLLESIIHPLVALDRKMFLDEQRRKGTPVCVFDIPLLFENKTQDEFESIIVVSAAPHIQRERVLARPGMSEEKFNTIIERQMPDSHKRELADYVIKTDIPIEETRKQVEQVLEKIKIAQGI